MAAETPIAGGDQPESIPTPAPVEPNRVPGRPLPTQPLGQGMPREVQPGEMGYEQVPGIPEVYGPGYGVSENGYGPNGGGCGSCGGCDGECYGDEDCTCGMHRLGVAQLLGNMSLFAGVQGFKGPVDTGQNGNFGFHEGFNFGGPLGDPWCTGYQIGFQGVESNFAGSQADGGSTHGREQAFLTAGLFHRATCGGLQGGMAFDYMHDSYYVKTDLKQVRSEVSLVFGGGSEIGYWGAYGVSKEQFQLLANAAATIFQPNDIFAAFYRKTSPGGGQGRIWAGATGGGEGIVGAEVAIPLGSAFALENSFTYLDSQHGPNSGGQLEEGWTLAIQLVWYPGRPASSRHARTRIGRCSAWATTRRSWSGGRARTRDEAGVACPPRREASGGHVGDMPTPATPVTACHPHKRASRGPTSSRDRPAWLPALLPAWLPSWALAWLPASPPISAPSWARAWLPASGPTDRHQLDIWPETTSTGRAYVSSAAGPRDVQTDHVAAQVDQRAAAIGRRGARCRAGGPWGSRRAGPTAGTGQVLLVAPPRARVVDDQTAWPDLQGLVAAFHGELDRSAGAIESAAPFAVRAASRPRRRLTWVMTSLTCSLASRPEPDVMATIIAGVRRRRG